MVTIRISDRQRLIQPYVHNYSWLLFAALTLYSADLANGEEVEGEKLDSQVLSHARVLQHQCIQLIGDCLMKAQHGKGESAPPSRKQWFQQASEEPGIAHFEVSKGKGKPLCTLLGITVYGESKCRTSVVRCHRNMENSVLEKINFMFT